MGGEEAVKTFSKSISKTLLKSFSESSCKSLPKRVLQDFSKIISTALLEGVL